MPEVSDSAREFTIVNVDIVDGTGAPPFRGFIHGRGDRIIDVGRGDPPPAGERVYDGTGLTAAPGFIDAHVHTDLGLLSDPLQAPTLRQGVTTQVLGQDGLSVAPMSAANLAEFMPFLAPIYGRLSEQLDSMSVQSFRALLDGKAVNTVYQVPHGTLRFEVLGMSDRPLVGSALAEARARLGGAFQEGAAGLSSGLSYFPGSFADTKELVQLCQVAARYGRPYTTHVRSVFTHGYVDPLQEAIEIATRAEVPLHVSHHRTNRSTLGRVDEVLEPLDRAHASGLELSFDMYPYVYGAGPLYICLPPWAFVGGIERVLERLADRSMRDELAAGIRSNAVTPEGTLTQVPGQPELEGRSIAELADEAGESVEMFVCDLLLHERLNVSFHQGVASLMQDTERLQRFERDVLELIERPYACVGSDGIYLGSRPHERGYGTFPRMIRIARERCFPLETLVNRMTLVPAQRFGLCDRGVIRPGATADIVIFDAMATRERGNHQQPQTWPEGVRTVIVNGELALEDGLPTGVRAGRALAPC